MRNSKGDTTVRAGAGRGSLWCWSKYSQQPVEKPMWKKILLTGTAACGEFMLDQRRKEWQREKSLYTDCKTHIHPPLRHSRTGQRSRM